MPSPSSLPPSSNISASNTPASKAPTSKAPVVAVIMGSQSDWATMQFAVAMLEKFQVPYETRIVSAHRTPDRLFHFAKEAEERGIEVIIAGAGGAAHLPGMVASMTTLPVLGVPIESHSLRGLDSLLSIVQMPAGVPVATFAIGKAGAENAALFALSILARSHLTLAKQLADWRAAQTDAVDEYPQSLQD